MKPDPLLIVDGVTDPRNLGAIMRSAECAGARGLVLARDRTTGVTPAAVKASSGAWVHLKIARCGNVSRPSKRSRPRATLIVALAPDGRYLAVRTRRLAPARDRARRRGLRGVREIVKHNADFVVSIPMRGRVASLNVSVAAAVTLFELARRREQQ